MAYNISSFVAPTLEFHLATDKSSTEYGLQICKWADTILNKGYNNYFFDRNQRFDINRRWAEGKQDMTRFMDLLRINGKNAYINLDFTSPAIMKKYIQLMMDEFMDMEEKVKVEAVDIMSNRKKMKEKKHLEYLMKQRELIAQLSQQAGYPLEDPNKFMPRNETELDLYFNLEYKIPEEAICEKAIDKVLKDNDINEIKRTVLRDMIITGLGVMRVYVDTNGFIKIRRVEPERFFYSWTNYPDFRDAAFVGEIYDMPVREFRQRFWQDGDEKELFERIVRNYSNNDARQRMSWTNDYYYAMFKPYDDWTIPMLYIEVKTTEQVYVKTKKTKYGYDIVDISTTKPTNTHSGTKVEEKIIESIYSGWYVRGSNYILRWSKCSNNPRRVGNLSHQMFSYCAYMYDGYHMVNKAIPEIIEPSVTQMILVHLKIQQIIAKMRPPGVAYDLSGMADIMLANGRTMTVEDIQQYFQQTGDIYYSSISEDGIRREGPPVQELRNSESIAQLNQLIEIYNFYQNRLISDIGTSLLAAEGKYTSRTPAYMYQQQKRSSISAVSQIYDGWQNLLKEVGERIVLLSWDKIIIDIEEYKRIVDNKGEESDGKEFDIEDEELGIRIHCEDDINLFADFTVSITLAPTREEKERLTQMINAALSAGVITFEDAFKIQNISNTRLAEMYLSRAYERQMEQQMLRARQTMMENQMIQQASNEAAARAKAYVEMMKARGTIIQQDMKGEQQKELELQKFIQNALLTSLKTGQPLDELTDRIVKAYLSGNLDRLTTGEQERQMPSGQPIQQQYMSQQAQQEQQPQTNRQEVMQGMEQ